MGTIPKGVMMLLWDRHFLLPPPQVAMRKCCNWKFSRAPHTQSFPVAQRARRQTPVVHRKQLELEQLVTRNPLQTQRELMIKKTTLRTPRLADNTWNAFQQYCSLSLNYLWRMYTTIANSEYILQHILLANVFVTEGIRRPWIRSRL